MFFSVCEKRGKKNNIRKFRSGACWEVGKGRFFYFRPGHETFPTYYDANVLRTIVNGVRWAAPGNGPEPVYHNRKPLEDVPVE